MLLLLVLWYSYFVFCYYLPQSSPSLVTVSLYAQFSFRLSFFLCFFFFLNYLNSYFLFFFVYTNSTVFRFSNSQDEEVRQRKNECYADIERYFTFVHSSFFFLIYFYIIESLQLCVSGSWIMFFLVPICWIALCPGDEIHPPIDQ